MSSNLIEKCIYEKLLYVCCESIKVKCHPEFFVTDIKKKYECTFFISVSCVCGEAMYHFGKFMPA